METVNYTIINYTTTEEPPAPFVPNEECVLPQNNEFYILTPFEAYSLLASACIILCLMLLEKRSSKACNCIGQRPGIVFPVNLLDHGCDNFGYSMAFGSVASYCFKLFFNDGNLFDLGPAWSKTLFVMLYVLAYGLMFYPLFACLTTTWVFVGSFFGVCYTGLWIYYTLRTVIKCPNGFGDGTGSLPGQDIAVQIPVLFCLICLFLRYGYILLRHSKNIVKERTLKKVVVQHEREHLGTKYNVLYARELLVPACGSRAPLESIEPREKPPWHKKIRILISQHLYKNDPTFKYSPRIICIFTVALICAYQFGIIILLSVYQVQKLVPYLHPTNATDADGYDFLRQLVYVFNGCTLFSFTVSSLMTFFATFRILTEYRNNIKMMFRGQFSHLPFTRTSRHPIFILSDSLSYAGSQVAYTLWGYLIVFFTLVAISMILMYLVVLPILGQVPSLFLESFWNVVSGFAVMQVVMIGQKLMSRGFLQSKESADEKGKLIAASILAIDNRKAYHNVSYFLFFFYIVLGVFGCLVTILKGVILGIVYLARLDKCGLVSGFETWDTGYMYYVSFLHIEECHRHPVFLVFCDILLDHVHKKQNICLKKYGSTDSVVDSGEENPNMTYYISSSRRLARNRWFKAYTLIRNPGIREQDFEADFDTLSELDVVDGNFMPASKNSGKTEPDELC